MMMRPSRWSSRLPLHLLIIVFLSSPFLSIPNEAGAEKSAADIQYAQEMILKGQSLLKKKQYRAAISYFERSQARVPEVNNLFMIGAIYTKLKDCPQALNYWSEAQKLCGRCALSEKLDTAIIKHTSPCSVDISVQSLPRAQVNIDGKFLGDTPYLGRVLHGSHQVTLSSVGHQPQVIRVQATSNRPVNIDITLAPQGTLLGVNPEKSKPAFTPPSPPPSVNYASPSTIVSSNAGMPAEAWLAAEEAADKQRGSSKVFKQTFMITGLVLGMSSIGLYGYTRYKHASLVESAKTNFQANPALANEASNAASLQFTSGVLLSLSALSLATSLLVF